MRSQSDRGSAAPLFLGMVAVLLCLSFVVVSSGALLLQQRRLNGLTDAMALGLVGSQTAPHELLAALTEKSRQVSIEAIRYEALADQPRHRVWVRLCQPNSFVISRLFAGGTVCAQSAARSVN